MSRWQQLYHFFSSWFSLCFLYSSLHPNGGIFITKLMLVFWTVHTFVPKHFQMFITLISFQDDFENTAKFKVGYIHKRDEKNEYSICGFVCPIWWRVWADDSCSLHVVCVCVCVPQVQLFSDPGFQGSVLNLEDSSPSLQDGFSVASCKVLAGRWVRCCPLWRKP